MNELSCGETSPFKIYLLHWEKLLLLGMDFHSLSTLRLYCLRWSARELSSYQVSMAGWALTSHVNGANKSSLFCLSSIKCLYPPQGKWSVAFEVCHLPANGAALGRKCVLTVQDLAGFWFLWRINLFDKWWWGRVPPLLSSGGATSVWCDLMWVQE